MKLIMLTIQFNLVYFILQHHDKPEDDKRGEKRTEARLQLAASPYNIANTTSIEFV